MKATVSRSVLLAAARRQAVMLLQAAKDQQGCRPLTLKTLSLLSG